MIPTPTPYPTADVEITLMPLTDGLNENLFYQAHQWWQMGESFGVTQLAQILILVVLIFAAVFIVSRAFSDMD